jgi:putative chitinase
MRISELLSEEEYQRLDEGPHWDAFKKQAKGAALGAGLVGAAALGFGNKAPKEPVQPPAITVPQDVAKEKEPEPSVNTQQDTKKELPTRHTSQNVDSKRQAFIVKKAQEAGIKGVELAAFLAQSAHETRGFNALGEEGGKEYLKKQYDPKHNKDKAQQLGNIKAGSGHRFAGAGYLMLTGPWNYTAAAKDLGIPIDKHPELVYTNPEVAAKTAIWFWQNKVSPSVKDWNDVRSVTKRINPGLAGIEDREANFIDFKKKLGLK